MNSRVVPVAGAVLALWLPAELVLLLLGGPQVSGCLALTCPPARDPSPIWVAALAAVPLLALAAAALVVVAQWATLRAGVRRNGLRLLAATAAVAMVGLADGWATGHRLLAAGEGALMGAGLGLVVGATAWLALAGLLTAARRDA